MSDTSLSPNTCLQCRQPLQPGQTCPTCASRRAQNKSRGTVIMVIGAIIALAGGIPCAIGQELPVFIVCGIVCVAGLAIAAFGKKMADRP